MTIAKTGPAGYEHQYRISVLVGLLFESDKPQLFIESVGEEDATLLLRQGGRSSKIEIQIKSSKKAVDIEDIAEILATFPKGQYKDCLLERLLSHPDSMAFLFFGGRCKDSLSSLLVPLSRLPSMPRTSDPLDQNQAKQLLNAFGAAYHGGKATRLRKARNARCADLVGSTDVDTIKVLARRIYVIEQTGSEHVLDEIQRVLVKNLRVPEAVARKLADAPLRRLVETARDNSSDCVPLLLKEVRQHQSDAIYPRQPYLVHEYEDDLYERLKRDRVLLLTGLPLSGKTQLAHSLAQREQAEGVHVVKSRQVDEAYRFLLDPAEGESRLVLLEDPFGKLQLSGAGVEDWNRLAELITGAALLATRKWSEDDRQVGLGVSGERRGSAVGVMGEVIAS